MEYSRMKRSILSRRNVCAIVFLLFGFWGFCPDSVVADNSVESITQGQYIQKLAEKIPGSSLLPPDATSFDLQQLYNFVVSRLESRGIIIGSTAEADTPLTRKDFINITYSFLSEAPLASDMERKYFLKEKGIVNPNDIGIFTSFEGLVRATRFTSNETVDVSSAVPVLFKDKIETDEDSRVVLRFDDMSVLTLGEESLVLINEMLYDPQSKSRQTVINLVRGKLRVKAAKISSVKTNFEIHTPTAVIGVRGTEFLVDVDRKGHTKVITLEGLVSMKPLPKVRERASGQSDHQAEGQEGEGEQSDESGGDEGQGADVGGSGDSSGEGGEILVGANAGGSVGADGALEQLELTQVDIDAAVQPTTMVNPVVIDNNGSVDSREVDELLSGGGLVPTIAGPNDEPPEDEPPVDEPPVDEPPEVYRPEVNPGDLDSDGDSYSNNIDVFPFDPLEWADSDGDGVGDNGDAYPQDATRWLASSIDISEFAASFQEDLSTELNALGIESSMILSAKEKVYQEAGYNLAALANDDWNSYFGSAVNGSFGGLGEEMNFSDDDYSRHPIGFIFPFYGNTYDDLYVTSNGWIALTNSTETTEYSSLWEYWLYEEYRDETTGQIDERWNQLLDNNYATIAPFGTDLDPRYGGEVFIETSEDNNKWRAQWVRLPHYGDSNATESSFSLTLFSGGEIAFLYDGLNESEDDWFSLLVGISPGADSEGVAPPTSYIDISDYSPSQPFVGDPGAAIFEGFYNDGDSDYVYDFDLDYTAVLFEPYLLNGAVGYTMTPFSSAQLVEPANLDEAYALRQGANLAGADEIAAGFLPSQYAYGLQVGDYINQELYEAIDSSELLAYAVQVEEDVVNREALATVRDHGDEMFANGEWSSRNELWYTVNNVLDYGSIRKRDAALAEIADAKAGRVLKDAHGNWLRVQQYLFRPDPNTIQVVDVNLRAAGADEFAGLTVMDWRTRFTSVVPAGSDILTLPWSDYLTTQEVGSERSVANATSYELSSMSVNFRHGSDSLTESRGFDSTLAGRQVLTAGTEALEVNGKLFAYDSSVGSASTYLVETISGESNLPFHYYIRDENNDYGCIDFYGFVVGNALDSSSTGLITGYESLDISNIWEALLVNMAGGVNIGSNNLEIYFDEYYSDLGLLNQPIDIIYVPLPSMEWKTPAEAYQPPG